MKIIKKSFNCFAILNLSILLASCEKIIKIDPPNSELVRTVVFNNEETARSAMAAPYVELARGGFASGSVGNGMNFLGGLSSDELIYIGNSTNSDIIEVFTNSITPSNSYIKAVWDGGYKIIYIANSLLEGASNSENISNQQRKQITGEALFIRAFCHFYMLCCFGDIPYIKSTDYQKNTNIERSPINEVYELIENDLLVAKDFLEESYEVFGGNRTRPIEYAADALLARLYLYQGDWAQAELSATSVISETALYQMSELADIFKANSAEAIWQLEPTLSYTWAGSSFIPSPAVFQYTRFAMLSGELVSSFEATDLRRAEWIGEFLTDDLYYYPYKYKKSHSTLEEFDEYYMVLRLAEQYLIRAEARARLQKRDGAISDLDVIRSRTRLPLITDIQPNIDYEALLDMILKERRLELMTEWGHRWFDLRRFEKANETLGHIKPGWRPEALWFPIPESEILLNPKLLPQNSGY